MKRLLFAAVLAAALHIALLASAVRWLRDRPEPEPDLGPLTLSLEGVPRMPHTQEVPKRPVEEPKAPAQRPPKEPPDVPRLPEEILHPSPLPRVRPSPAESAVRPGSLGPRPEVPPEPRVLSSAGPAAAPPAPAGAVPDLPGVEGPAPVYQAPGKEAMTRARPLYKVNPPPEYPPRARRRGHEGLVVLRVLVDRQGKVRELDVERSSGYRMLDRAAISSVRSWRFEPGTKGDEPVEMWVKVPVRFELRR